MSFINEVKLLGYLGKDPEVLKSTDKGDFVRLTLATTKKTMHKGEMFESTQWHTVYVSNGTGKACAKSLSKGSRILISGELQTKRWEKDGENHYSTDVYALNVIFLDASKTSSYDQHVEETPDGHKYAQTKEGVF